MKNAAQSGEPKPIAGWVLALLSLAVGLVAGFGTVVFRDLIGVFHNLLFLGRFSFYYDANIHTAPSPWGAWVIFVPVLGAVGVAYLVKNFAPEAKGHGVPEVMDAIYYNDGKIRSVVAVIKSLASALSIGSGGSVGREGPIIQIGAAFGSTLGQLIAIPAKICPPRTARASPLCPSWKRRAFHVPSECLPRRAVRGLGAHSPIKPFSLHPLKGRGAFFSARFWFRTRPQAEPVRTIYMHGIESAGSRVRTLPFRWIIRNLRSKTHKEPHKTFRPSTRICRRLLRPGTSYLPR